MVKDVFCVDIYLINRGFKIFLICLKEVVILVFVFWIDVGYCLGVYVYKVF